MEPVAARAARYVHYPQDAVEDLKALISAFDKAIQTEYREMNSGRFWWVFRTTSGIAEDHLEMLAGDFESFVRCVELATKKAPEIFAALQPNSLGFLFDDATLICRRACDSWNAIVPHDPIEGIKKRYQSFAEEVAFESLTAEGRLHSLSRPSVAPMFAGDKATIKPTSDPASGRDPFESIQFYVKEIRDTGFWDTPDNPTRLHGCIRTLSIWLEEISYSQPTANPVKWFGSRRELIGVADTLFHIGTAIKAAGALRQLPITSEDMESVRFIINETVRCQSTGRLLELDAPSAVNVPAKLRHAVGRLTELSLVAWHFTRVCPAASGVVVDDAAQPSSVAHNPPHDGPDDSRLILVLGGHEFGPFTPTEFDVVQIMWANRESAWPEANAFFAFHQKLGWSQTAESPFGKHQTGIKNCFRRKGFDLPWKRGRGVFVWRGLVAYSEKMNANSRAKPPAADNVSRGKEA